MDDFERFFEEQYRQVTGALAVAFGDRAVAEDAAQEAFARALRRWPTVRATERPAAWVYVVAVRYARRRATRERALLERVERVRALRTLDADEDCAVNAVLVRSALAALPERQRLAVLLRYFARLSTAETAEAMGCAPGKVKSTLHAALVALGVQLRPDPEEVRR